MNLPSASLNFRTAPAVRLFMNQRALRRWVAFNAYTMSIKQSAGLALVVGAMKADACPVGTYWSVPHARVASAVDAVWYDSMPRGRVGTLPEMNATASCLANRFVSLPPSHDVARVCLGA